MRLNGTEVFEDRKGLDGKDGEELDSRKWEENPETRTEESKKNKALKHPNLKNLPNLKAKSEVGSKLSSIIYCKIIYFSTLWSGRNKNFNVA